MARQFGGTLLSSRVFLFFPLILLKEIKSFYKIKNYKKIILFTFYLLLLIYYLKIAFYILAFY
jgi:hypothetical protein